MLFVLIPKLRPIIAPALQLPMVPPTAPNEEWRKSTFGQSNADPLQIVNPLPITLQLNIKMSLGHVHLLTFMSSPDPLPISILWVIRQGLC